MRRIWHDRSSLGFGGPLAQALGGVALLGIALLSGAVDARLRLPDSIADDPTATAVVADRTRTVGEAPTQPLLRVLRAAPRFDPVDALDLEMNPGRLIEASDLVRADIERGAFPGGALAVGRGADPVVITGIGRVSWNGAEVDPRRTMYDLASLTKVVGTTTAVMLLVEDGKMELDAPVSRYLPAFTGDDRGSVTIRHLLTHTSGLPAWAELWAASPEASLREAIRTPLRRDPGDQAVYSDIGFVVLYAAAERAAGEPIPRLLERRVFEPLGMYSTEYAPGEDCTRCAPTLRRSDGTDVRGIVHDPIARLLDGVAGNAGLFSTVEDLGRFSAMLANGGELNGKRILREGTIREFARRQPDAGNRALGWETPEADGTGAGGTIISPASFGHTGYTGTSIWIDTERGTWTVLLTNRTYEPRAANRIQALRRGVNDQVARAADFGGPPRLAD